MLARARRAVATFLFPTGGLNSCDVGYGSKAEIDSVLANVRFVPLADIALRHTALG